MTLEEIHESRVRALLEYRARVANDLKREQRSRAQSERQRKSSAFRKLALAVLENLTAVEAQIRMMRMRHRIEPELAELELEWYWL